MKALIATLIAVGVLYAVNSEYNDGRYSAVIQQAITTALPR